MKRIRELKEEKGVTQEELAFVLGISQQRVSKLLSGKSHFYPSEIKKCANYFHVTSDYLLGLTDNRGRLWEELSGDLISVTDVSESDKKLLMYYFSLLTEKQRKLILGLLESMVAGQE